MKYTLENTIERYEAGEKLKYVFFWGHTEKSEAVTKACFSQWYPSKFIVDGKEYFTTEHWMMAKKAELFDDLEIHDKILNSEKPGAVKDLGRRISGFNEKVWNENKYQIVLEGNVYKFSQNETLKEFLLNTKNRVLVEASPVDFIWGIGMAQDDQNVENPNCWNGPNLLGFALMETRDKLKYEL